MVCEGGAYGEASCVLPTDARVPTLLSLTFELSGLVGSDAFLLCRAVYLGEYYPPRLPERLPYPTHATVRVFSVYSMPTL